MDDIAVTKLTPIREGGIVGIRLEQQDQVIELWPDDEFFESIITEFMLALADRRSRANEVIARFNQFKNNHGIP